MKTLLTILLVGCGLMEKSAAFGSIVTKMPEDTVIRSRFESLAQQLRLKKPVLGEGEYEVRMWVKVELKYGDAQELYILHKKSNQLKVTNYSLKYNKHAFKGFKKQAVKQDISFWENLMANDIMTLPDMRSLQQFQPYKPVPQDTSRRVEVSNEGEVTVIMKKYKANNRVIIGDGTSYHFEVFGKGYHHLYNYSNPVQYSSHYTESAELRKVSAIIDQILRAF